MAHTAWRHAVACAAAFACALVLLASATIAPRAVLAAPHDTAFTGGSIEITSPHGSGAEYRAVRIADQNALPLLDALAWQDLAGSDVPAITAGGGLPSYDPTAPDAAAQGRNLVEAISRVIADDPDGSLAVWLSSYLYDAALATAPQIQADAGPVTVEDGWYLVIAVGKRPLVVWVKGTPVKLGDKSDTPTLDKEINCGEGWSDSGVQGADEPAQYRLVVTVPEAIDAYKTYELAFHDEWDEHLRLVDGSIQIVLVSAEGTPASDPFDVTAQFAVTVEGASFSARAEDLHALHARPGDQLVLTYRMMLDPTYAPGSDGLLNTAWATFPTWEGEGETPPDKTKVYAFQFKIKKTSPSDEPLAGAEFAVRNAEGNWLMPEGGFGAEQERLVLTSGDDGLTSAAPIIGAGTYTLVELKAPEGYVLPANPETRFTVAASQSLDELELTVTAQGVATVENVSANEGAFVLHMVDEAEEVPPPFGNLPETWDNLSPLGKTAVLVLLAAALALAGSQVLHRRHNGDEASVG